MKRVGSKIPETLEDLKDVQLYDQIKARRSQKTIEHDELCRQLGLSPLRYLRTRAGLTQSQLARKTGLSQSYLAKVEASERRLSGQARKKIAQALHLSPDQLIY
jgi:transcriptional regulator with XRE-family HTH domain